MTDHDDIIQRLATLEQGQRELRGSMQEILVVIQGPPREGSLRGRLHALENSNAAAKAAEAALQIARQLDRQRVSWRIKVLGAACALATVICTVVTTIAVTT